MAELNADGTSINARIVIWGPEGSGKSTNIERIYAKLRPDHRGELRRVPTRLDPTVTFEVLPIELGAIGGLKTTIQILGVPGATDAAPTRKNLLDKVDGIVLVMDSQRHALEANVASVQELKQALAAYGRSFKDVPVVIQYNKRDLSDDSAIEALHKKLDLAGVPVFEAVATDGTGVLQTLTTISKQVVRMFRESSAGSAPATPTPAAPAAPTAKPSPNFLASAPPAASAKPAAAAPAARRPVPPAADAGKTVVQFDAPAPTPNRVTQPTVAPKPTTPTTTPLRPTPLAADAGKTVVQFDAPAPAKAPMPAPAAAAPIPRPAPTVDAGRTVIQFEDESLTSDTATQFAQEGLDLLEATPVEEAPSLTIVSVGAAKRVSDSEVCVSLVLQDETGQARPIQLNIRLDNIKG